MEYKADRLSTQQIRLFHLRVKHGLHVTDTRTAKRKLYYYRCLGSDNYRYPNGRICDNRPVRQDYLDDLVWKKVVQLLENPEIVHKEIDRRIREARNSNPTKIRKETLVKERARVQNGIDRLLDAYQEGLLELPEMRTRINELRKRESALKSELQSLEAKMVDQGTYLQLVNNIDGFLSRIRKSVECLTVLDRQRVLRLIVKEILVGPETVTIKHSIPTTVPVSEPTVPSCPSGYSVVPSYLLCGRSHQSLARKSLPPLRL